MQSGVTRRTLLRLGFDMVATSGDATAHAKLRAAVEAGLDAWFILDAVLAPDGGVEDFVYADMNSLGARLIGRPIGECLGHRILELFPQAAREVAKLGNAMRGGAALEESYTSSVPAYVGRRFHRHMVPIGTSIALVVRDETDRYREAQALAESEERFRLASEHSAMGMALVGLDGSWLSVNPALCDLLGYSVGELRSRTFATITHPDDLPLDLESRDRMLRGETSHYAREKRYLHRDGHVVWVHITVSLVRSIERTPLYFLAQVNDVSERRNAEEALRASETAHRELLAALPVVVYWVSPRPPYAPIYVSRGIAALGYSVEEWLIEPDMWVKSIHPDDRDQVLQQTEAALASAAGVEYEYRVVTKSGDIRWIHDRGEFVRDSRGGTLAWRGVMLDVTERRVLQDRLAAMSAEDELTGLLNRRGFRRMGEQALKVEQRSGRRTAMLYFDLRHFKSINDTYGHSEGDAALRIVADALRTGVRDGDLVARMGGDEFVILAVGTGAEGEGVALAQRLCDRARVAKRESASGAHDYAIELSFGVFETNDSLSLDDLLRLADEDLYARRRS